MGPKPTRLCGGLRSGGAAPVGQRCTEPGQGRGPRGFAPYRGSALRGMRHGARLVVERGPRPLGIARRQLLPSCSGEEEERPRGERWRLRSALSGESAESRSPQALARRGPVRLRHRKVDAPRFNFSGPRHSPERGTSAPTSVEEPGESSVRALVAQFFAGLAAAFP